MTDSANTVEACACGGYLVITPARPGAEPNREHRNADNQPAPCPLNR
ncbi:hypothetical protein [Streptomyces sp. NPDC054834]